MKRILVAIAGMLFAASLFAQAYPSKAVRIVVPYPPGGGTDVLARLVGRYMGESFGQPVVVENRPGANGLIGMDMVAKAPADGYTLLAIAAGPLDSEHLPRFAPIALFAAPSYLLVVHPAVPAASLAEFIAHAKKQPGKLAYGSTGGGAASHLTAELFKAMAGVDLLHVPYKGVGPAVTDLLGGQVQMMVAPTPAVVQHARSGKLRALAATGARRSVAMPDLPTLAEAGVSGYEATGWFGLVAAAGTPGDIVNRLNGEVNRVLRLADVTARLHELGAEPAQTTPASFLAFIRADNAKWAALIKERNIVIEKAR